MKQRVAEHFFTRRAGAGSLLAWIGVIGIFSCILLLANSCSLPERANDTITETNLVTSSIPGSGCGKPAPFAPGLSENETISSGGYERQYRMHLPSGYSSSVAQPLVLNFHGHGSTATIQERLTKLSLLADQQDFIAIYPQGMIGPDHHSGWATGPAWDPHVNDVLFVSDLLNRLQSTLCINPLRIYAMGFSNGGGMTNLLAARMAGRIAAFASVSGSYFPVAGGYHPVRPVPFLEIHGTADRVVPYNGSISKDYSSVTSWLLSWVQRDRCNNRPDIFLRQKTMIGEQWPGCRAGATVIHYRVLGERHTWPHVLFSEQIQKRWYRVTATDLIWQFFQDHPMPGRQVRNKTPSKLTTIDSQARLLHVSLLWAITKEGT
jgi:polyhydroxybutyrate depolymerase